MGGGTGDKKSSSTVSTSFSFLPDQALQLAETLLPLQNHQQVLIPQCLPLLSLLMVIAVTPMDWTAPTWAGGKSRNVLFVSSPFMWVIPCILACTEKKCDGALEEFYYSCVPVYWTLLFETTAVPCSLAKVVHVPELTNCQSIACFLRWLRA